MLHCHLRLPVPLVRSFNHENPWTSNATAFQISAQLGSARLSYSDLTVSSLDTVHYLCTAAYLISAVLGRVIAIFPVHFWGLICIVIFSGMSGPNCAIFGQEIQATLNICKFG